MNLRDLQYLVAIAEHKHFGKAAKASYVSQPTLSAQLKKLEEYLGVQLIERNPRQVMITPIGKIIVEKAQQILENAREIQEIAKQARDPFSGTLKIGIIPTLAPYLLPHIVPPLKKTFPKLELFIFEEQTTRILQQLKDAKLDVIILALPVETEGFVIHPLFAEPFYAALPYEHRLSKKKAIAVSDLKDETLLLLTEGHCLRNQALAICHNVYIKQKPNFSATSLETLRHMVIAGAGITLLPELAIIEPHTLPQLLIRPFRDPKPVRQIGMLWRKTASQQILFIEVMQLIKSHMALHFTLNSAVGYFGANQQI